MSQQTKYPQIVNYLRGALNGQGDKALVAEITDLIGNVSQLELNNKLLSDSNQHLAYSLEQAENIIEQLSSAVDEDNGIPHFPDDFESNAFATDMSDEEIREMVGESLSIEGEYPFTAVSQGNTIVIRLTNDEGDTSIIVAKDYWVVDIPADEEEVDCGPNCGCLF